MKWRKNEAFKLISILLSIIFTFHCTTIKTGKLISTEERVNKNKILAYQYKVEKIKNPYLHDPTVTVKIEKFPIYAVETVNKYEKIKKFDKWKTSISSVILVFAFCYGLSYLGDSEPRNHTLYLGISLLVGLMSTGSVNVWKTDDKKVGEILKVGKSYPANPSIYPLPAKNFPVQFEWNAGYGKKQFKTRTDNSGLVKISLIKDLIITKFSSDKDTLDLFIKFMGDEPNKFLRQDFYLSPESWLMPYIFRLNSFQVDVYKGPSYSSEKLTDVGLVQEMAIHSVSKDWVKINTGDGYGWVSKTSGRILYVDPASATKEYEPPRKKVPPLSIPVKAKPVIVVGFPKENFRTYNASVDVIGTATDDKEIKKIEIKVNNKRLERTRRINVVSKDKHSKDFNVSVPLQIGKNRIEIFAIDNDGLTTPKDISVTRLYQKSDIWVVAIGINNYSNKKIPVLNYSVNDANGIADYFKIYLNVPEDHVSVLLNEKATLTELKTVLGTELKNKAKKNDMVIIFFSGHGSRELDPKNPDQDGFEKYLLPYNADLDNQYATALPMREIREIFNRINANTLIFIADTCFSGNIEPGGRTCSPPSTKGITSDISEFYLDRISIGEGRIILAASKADEVAREDGNLKHGVFTYYLLKGLKGDADFDHNGLISIPEIYKFVVKKVQYYTRNNQTPQKNGKEIGEVVFRKIK